MNFYVYNMFWTLSGEMGKPWPNAIWNLLGHTFAIFLLLVWQMSPFCCFFWPIICALFLLLLLDRSQLITLKVGVVNSDNMAKIGCKSSSKGILVLKPWGFTRSKRAVQALDALPRINNYAQGIFHGGDSMGHTAVLDTVSQQFIVGMGGWEIINRYDNWIYAS